MQAIPNSVLIHVATLKQYQGEDVWGIASYNDVALTNILIQPTRELKMTKDNREIQLKSVLFYDLTNSKPQGTTFSQEDLIIFNGVQYKVVYIDTLYGYGLHHYEIGLV